MSRISDNQILSKIENGDVDAFGELYSAYIQRIYRFILFKVQTHEEAEDLSADVFLRAWQHLYHQRRPVQHLNAFLYQIAKNIVIDFYRERRNQGRAMTDAIEQIADRKQQQLFRQIEQSVELSAIERSVRQLKDEYKDAVLLRYVEELTIAEISEILGKSRGHVRVILFRALKLIRDQLQANQ